MHMNNRYNNLNIDIYGNNEDGFLYVRFDIVNNSPYFETSSLVNLHDVAVTFHNERLLFEDFRDGEIPDKKTLKHMLQIMPNEPDNLNSFKGKHTLKNISDKMNVKINHETVIYKLSMVPHVMINWVACFSVFMNVNTNFSIIQFSDHNHLINHITENENVFRPENNNKFSVRTLMEKLITFKDSFLKYKNALNDLDKIYKYYAASRDSDQPKSLLRCLSSVNRCELLYSEQLKKLTDAEDAESKTMVAQQFAKEMVSKEEFLFMLDSIHTRNKIVLLIEPCLGKIAHDRGKYKKSYTELMLIYFGNLYLFPEGKMGIGDLDKNPSYLADYDKGKPNHNILASELKHLAPLISVEFDYSCDVHKEKKIMFEPGCSLRLMNEGLHLTSDYCKELFNVHKKWAFFTRIQLAEGNLFNLLPNEILDDILVKSSSSQPRNNNIKANPGFFQAVASGRERGKKEHEEVENRSVMKL